LEKYTTILYTVKYFKDKCDLIVIYRYVPCSFIFHSLVLKDCDIEIYIDNVYTYI